MRHFIFLFSVFFFNAAYATDGLWLLVDTQSKVLYVKQGEEIVDTFTQLSLGKRGSGPKLRRGDGVTPVGHYKVISANEKSHFKIFYGLNYPSEHDAERALNQGRISYQQYQRIMHAHSQSFIPPQHTVLGGQIGIHGVGSGNPDIQGLFDWTKGCIALSNQQITELSKWMYVGMPVEIK